MIPRKKGSKGFTIVELLIVVVVIAILAAITIVAYNGITSRTKQASLQTTLQQVAKQVANYQTLNSAFPGSLAALNDGQGPKVNSDILLAYTLEGTSYCITIGSTLATDKYYVCGNTGTVQSGVYSTHTTLIAGYPTRDGYTNMTGVPGVTIDTNLADIGAIPVGSWMIVVLSYNNAGDPIPPAGWTALVTRKTTNTMQTSIYAKIKQAGDVAAQEFDASGTNGYAFTNAVLLWGSNSAPVGSWVLGAWGDRAVNATTTTAVTPTVNVATARSLVLSIATERTSAAETNYTSLTGVNPWIWIPQPDSNRIQTIAIGYSEQAATGTSAAMTVTYPNPQNTNASGIQIVIPPSV